MAYNEESAPWQRRRRRRQRITMAIVVVLVIVAGLVAAGLYLGVLGVPAKNPPTAVGPVPCPTVPAPPPLAPRRIKVNVYNATGRAGLAANTAAQLRRRGFAIGVVANDPTRAKVGGAADVRYGARGTVAAHVVAAQVSGARLVPDRRLAPTVDLVLGPQFTGLAPKPTTPSSRPSCAPGPGSATSAPTTAVPKTRPTTTPR